MFWLAWTTKRHRDAGQRQVSLVGPCVSAKTSDSRIACENAADDAADEQSGKAGAVKVAEGRATYVTVSLLTDEKHTGVWPLV